MNHAITIGGLLLSVGALVAVASIAFGAVEIFAQGMSDAPQENQGAGCIFLVGGAALLIGCVAWMVL